MMSGLWTFSNGSWDFLQLGENEDIFAYIKKKKFQGIQTKKHNEQKYRGVEYSNRTYFAQKKPSEFLKVYPFELSRTLWVALRERQTLFGDRENDKKKRNLNDKRNVFQSFGDDRKIILSENTHSKYTLSN